VRAHNLHTRPPALQWIIAVEDTNNSLLLIRPYVRASQQNFWVNMLRISGVNAKKKLRKYQYNGILCRLN
jgi:hypothetical protein